MTSIQDTLSLFNFLSNKVNQQQLRSIILLIAKLLFYLFSLALVLLSSASIGILLRAVVNLFFLNFQPTYLFLLPMLLLCLFLLSVLLLILFYVIQYLERFDVSAGNRLIYLLNKLKPQEHVPHIIVLIFGFSLAFAFFIYNSYSVVSTTSVAYSLPADGYHHLSSQDYAEVIESQTMYITHSKRFLTFTPFEEKFGGNLQGDIYRVGDQYFLNLTDGNKNYTITRARTFNTTQFRFYTGIVQPSYQNFSLQSDILPISGHLGLGRFSNENIYCYAIEVKCKIGDREYTGNLPRFGIFYLDNLSNPTLETSQIEVSGSVGTNPKPRITFQLNTSSEVNCHLNCSF